MKHGNVFVVFVIFATMITGTFGYPLLNDAASGHTFPDRNWRSGAGPSADWWGTYFSNIGGAGERNVTILSVQLVGTFNDSFQIMGGNQSGVVIPTPNDNGPVKTNPRTIYIAFTPKFGYLGFVSARLRVVTDWTGSGGSTYELEVRGTGVDWLLGVQPEYGMFGWQHVAIGPTPPIMFTLSNLGSVGDLQINSVTLCNGNWANFCPDFQIVGETTTQFILTPGQTYSVNITFDPTFFNPVSAATLNIESTDVIRPSLIIPLNGTATNQYINLLTSRTLSFPNRDTSDVASATQTVTIKNIGDFGIVHITNVSFIDGNPENFVLDTNGNPASLIQQAEQSYLVSFKPVMTGQVRTALKIVTDDILQPILIVNISGRGVHPKLNLTTTFIDFGSQDIFSGQSSVVRTVTVGNYGLTTLNISRLQVAINPGRSFLLSLNCTATAPCLVNPSATFSFNVTWRPIQPNGFYYAIVTIGSDDFSQPIANVTLNAQAIERMDRLFGNNTANVTFIPPYAGQLSRMSMMLHTADTGLPSKGSVELTFPPGFSFGAMYGSIQNVGLNASDIVVDPVQRTVRMKTVNHPEIGYVSNGSVISVILFNVILPNDCNTTYPSWRWNVTTRDEMGRLVEYFYNQDIPGDFCLESKVYSWTSTPAPIDAVTLVTGSSVNFTILVRTPDILLATQMDLLNTYPGGDQAKIVDAYDPITGLETSCATMPPSGGAFPNQTQNLGEMDELHVLTATWLTSVTTGYYRLCYRQNYSWIGWEQVGDIFTVLRANSVGDPIPLYEYVGFPAPPNAVQPDWQDFYPRVAIAGERVEYTIAGFHSNMNISYKVKIASQGADCQGAADGTPVDGLDAVHSSATFTVTTAGVYKVCTKWHLDWEPIVGVLVIRLAPTANIPASEEDDVLFGYHTCTAFVNHFASQARCGCYFGTGTQAATADMNKERDLILEGIPPNHIINQGCCTRRTRRTTVRATNPIWGYCSR